MANLKTKRENMGRKIRAEFSKGVIRPLEKLDIEEGRKVTITVEEAPSEAAKTIESLKSSFGGWRNLIDTEKLKRNIYTDRLINTRPKPKL